MTEHQKKPKPTRHGTAWRAEDERQLYDAFLAGDSMNDIASRFERTCGGIRSHLKKLGLLDEEGVPIQPPPDYAPTQAAQKRATKAVEQETKQARLKKREAEEPASKTNINPRIAEALELLNEGQQSLFITGKAGTGKSTLLRHFRRQTKRNVVVLAPTGIAALNAGGETIHRFFRFSIDVTPQKIAARKKPRNAKLYKKLDTIIIDEVSMVRADVLDCIDAFLRLHGPHPGAAFGGVQMIFIGDLYQLPPVVGSSDRALFEDYYDTPYFFSAQVMRDFPLTLIELEKVYRQKDHAFIGILNRVRDNSVTDRDMDVINSRVDRDNTKNDNAFTITLTATNRRADEINQTHLDALKGHTHRQEAKIEGEFTRDYFPAPEALSFKIGAQIMMLTNDREGRWVNGSVGVIEALGKDVDQGTYVSVRLQDRDDCVAVFSHAWEVYHFALAGDEIQSQPVGTFTQYPFRLAWAVTIHKSQGKTFDRVAIDIGQGAFAAGQVYVALSRCTSLNGITLQTPIQRRHIQTDPRIQTFLGGYANRQEPPDESTDIVALIEAALRDQSPLDIIYIKVDGEEIRRTIYPRDLAPKTYQGMPFLGLKAFCPASDKEILFDVSKISSATAV